jgi:adenine-specific DNA-methyltransferase
LFWRSLQVNLAERCLNLNGKILHGVGERVGTGEGEERASVVPVILHSSFILHPSSHRCPAAERSYEDALHNLVTDATVAASGAKAAAFQAALGAESYRLHYLARLPHEANPSMLQTARLDHPFHYALEILTDDGAEPRTVDLVETFNWLLGLDVQSVRRWQHEKRDYLAVLGRDRANKRVLVVWRDATGLDPKAERAFLDKQVAPLTKDAPFDQMLINGDNAAGFDSLDALFKRLMEAE